LPMLVLSHYPPKFLGLQVGATNTLAIHLWIVIEAVKWKGGNNPPLRNSVGGLRV
jgi:hypothetical protein